MALTDPTFVVSPGSWQRGYQGTPTNSDKPIDAVIAQATPGTTIQLAPGRFRRFGPFNGKHGISINGWDDPYRSVILRDETVGSTDAVILGPGDGKLKLVNVVLEADDRAGFKTTSGVLPGVMLVDCSIHGYGNAFDPAWNDNSKWGVHAYDTADYQESRVSIFSICGEHARYFHNIKGNHTFERGTVAHCGRTALQIVNRANEGAPGVGAVIVQNQVIEDVCLEQGGGGSALTFRGGMPTSDVHLQFNKIRLGCRSLLASTFQNNIAGALLMDSSPESKPGAGDAAWPGGTHSLHMFSEDYEIGTIYPGKGSAIRPAVMVNNVQSFTMESCRVVVHRPPGAYAEALVIGDDVGAVYITGKNTVVGTVTYKGTKYANLEAFEADHPECFG
jgi:hypothetical protein